MASDALTEVVEALKELTRSESALIYNILNPSEVPHDQNGNERLDNAILSFFSTKAQPERLVFYLNDSYSEDSLRWDLLKGTDRIQAFNLFAVAKKQGRAPCLALVHNIETYDADDESLLIDSQKTLYYWVDEHNVKFNDDINPHDCESCYSETDTFEPDHNEVSKPSGFAGGKGNRRYPRACVVLWSSQWVFSHGFKNGLYKLHQLTNEVGEDIKLFREIEKIGPTFFKTDLWREPFVKSMLWDIALYLKYTGKAVMILSNIPDEVFREDRIDRIPKLQNMCSSGSWKKIYHAWKNHKLWPSIVDKAPQFIQLCISFSENLATSSVIDYLLKESIDSFISTNRNMRVMFGCTPREDVYVFNPNNSTNIQYIYGKTDKIIMEKLCDLLKTCAVLEKTPLQHQLIDHVLTSPAVYNAVSLSDVILTLQGILTPKQFLNCKRVRNVVLNIIHDQLSNLRNVQYSSWHWPITLPCQCNFCTAVKNFFHSKSMRTIHIAAAEDIRRHIYRCLDPLKDQPVEYHTEKTGKIIITKKERLLQDRKKLIDDLIESEKRMLELEFAKYSEDQFEGRILSQMSNPKSAPSKGIVVKHQNISVAH